jgi:hypothetical protein
LLKRTGDQPAFSLAVAPPTDTNEAHGTQIETHESSLTITSPFRVERRRCSRTQWRESG